MTREEAIEILRGLKPTNTVSITDAYNTGKALTMAIKALEQESILDKLRAEIKAIAFDWQEIDGEHESFMVVDLNDALNIIDKYKAESEG